MTFFCLFFYFPSKPMHLKFFLDFERRNVLNRNWLPLFLSDIVLSIFQRWGTKYWHQNSFSAECWIFHSLQDFSDFSYFDKKSIEALLLPLRVRMTFKCKCSHYEKKLCCVLIAFLFVKCAEQKLLKEWEDVTEIELKKYRSS